jgi:hypothetical protein
MVPPAKPSSLYLGRIVQLLTAIKDSAKHLTITAMNKQKLTSQDLARS